MSNNKQLEGRELKEDVSQSLLKRIELATSKYGQGKKLAAKAGLTYQSVYDLMKEKSATPTTIGKIEKALKKVA